jgi:hypothetical protein
MSILKNFFNRDDTADAPRGEDRTEEILRMYLDSDFVTYPMAERSASISNIRDIERGLGIRYPDEFVAHVCGRFPGVYVEVKEHVWPRAMPMDVGPFWSFLYGVHTYTPAKTSEDWMRLDVVAETFLRDTGHRVSPVMKVLGDADVYCADETGSLLRYLHETNELEQTGCDFWTLFELEIGELRERKERKKTGV